MSAIMAEATAAEGGLSESRLLLATSLWLVTAAAVRVPLLTAVAMHVPLVVYAHTIPRYLYAHATTLRRHDGRLSAAGVLETPSTTGRPTRPPYIRVDRISPAHAALAARGARGQSPPRRARGLIASASAPAVAGGWGWGVQVRPAGGPAPARLLRCDLKGRACNGRSRAGLRPAPPAGRRVELRSALRNAGPARGSGRWSRTRPGTMRASVACL